LVVAGCDPAVGLLARLLAERGVRLLALRRSSGESLELLRAGKVHLAGIHFGKVSVRDENAKMAGESLGAGCRLIRYVDWEEGLIGADHVSMKQPGSGFGHRPHVGGFF
jgi:molybdate-binding protein